MKPAKITEVDFWRLDSKEKQLFKSEEADEGEDDPEDWKGDEDRILK